MVSSRTTADSKHPIILNRNGRDASVHHHAQNTDIQIGTNEASPLAVGVPPAPLANSCATSMQSTNNSRYFTKFTAIAIVATYIVSSASAFTQPQNKMGATPISRPSLISSVCSENGLPSFSSRTQLFLSASTKSDPSNPDQKEWRAVFLTLQLYKAAFGDLKVPSKFVVPSAAPWPGM